MLRAVQASSLPAQAETEGGGGNGFLRRRQLPAPHGPFRRLPLMRSAAHRPRRQPERRGRGATGGSRHRGGVGAARPGSLPCPRGGAAPSRSRPRPGFSGSGGERPAPAARRLGSAARMAVGRRRQLRARCERGCCNSLFLPRRARRGVSRSLSRAGRCTAPTHELKKR
ncbi:putative hydro-lyase KRH_21160 isoform X1 [Aquila chrysaetos chrysaetos]|uniref:putative hydro-lyase KRH_21160 isoform X1 n=1 Tax=Aquila chrysaetos chrysaetos TaxID=223781 RepID=UPI001B7D46AB|nr:putative hydro-lyase KRH_21160 isoform X1 [Aquila chrysaetos chrysaetos]